MNTYFSVSLIPHLWVCLICLFLLKYLRPIAQKIDLVDYPGSRKTHNHPVALIGGVAIFLGVTSGLMLAPFGLGDYRHLFFACGILMVVGVLDDHRDVPASARLIAQLAVAMSLAIVGKIVVTDVGDIFGWDDGNEVGLDVLAVPLTVVAIVGVINAINMIDGHDGLAGSVFLISASALMFLGGISESWKHQYVLSLFSVGVISFLVFNVPFGKDKAKKVFLGDAGSMLLGAVLAFMLIILSEEEGSALKTVSAPWIIGLPLLDMVSVICIRIFSGGSPFVADRRHIHHFLIDLGLGKKQVLLILIVVQILFSGIGVSSALWDWPDPLLFWSMFLVLAGYLGLRRVLNRSL